MTHTEQKKENSILFNWITMMFASSTLLPLLAAHAVELDDGIEVLAVK